MRKNWIVLSVATSLLTACIPPSNPGITVTPQTGLNISEAGGTGTFTVVLDSEPTADVTIALSSSASGEGTVSPASLIFTPSNWETEQTVTVTGVDDNKPDGDQRFTIVTAPARSTDTRYDGMDAPDVEVSNTDNDVTGFEISPASGLITTESGGKATFTIRLTSEPSANVTIPVSSSAPDEGTVSPASLTFTQINWNAPQTVTVTGADDNLADGSQSYSVLLGAAISGDSGYGGKDPADVGVSNTDNDTAGVTITPTSGLTTTEAGGTATFTVVLNSQPAADVTITFYGSNTEGTLSLNSLTFTSDNVLRLSMPPPQQDNKVSLTFTPDNWSTPQTVTITGVDDDFDDGDQTYYIVRPNVVSEDPGYTMLELDEIQVTNIDDDTPGFTVAPTSGLTTTEAGGTATFTVALNCRPADDVTIALSSSDTDEGTVSPVSLTFTSFNWNVPQTVTITGVDDGLPDRNKVYSIITAPAVSKDPGYQALDPDDVNVTNIDDESEPAGFIVFPTNGLTTTEAGGTATFAVELNSQPTADVTIALSSSDTSEGTVSPASLTFTSENWNVSQMVTITGVDDTLSDANQNYSIITAPAVSADPNYNMLDPDDVDVTNFDNESSDG